MIMFGYIRHADLMHCFIKMPGYDACYGPTAPGPGPEEEKAYLLSEMKILQDQLSVLEKRMAELKPDQDKE